MPSLRLSYLVQGESFVHRLDPRVKLLYIVWVFAMIVVFSDPRYQSFAMLTLLGGVAAARISPGRVLKMGKFGIYVGVASWVLWTIFLSGEGRPLFDLGLWSVTDRGVLVGLSAALRITSVLFAFLLVAMTTPTRDIIVGLAGLRVPVVFSVVVGLILRLIPQLQAEHASIVEAQKSRATEFEKGGLLRRFRTHTTYVIPLSLRALKLVSQLSVALEARAFDPYARRTFARQLTLRPADKAVLAAMAASFALSVAVRVAGFGGLGGVPGLGQ